MRLINTEKNCTNCILKANNLICESEGSVFINRKIFKSTCISNISSYKGNLYFNDSITLYKINNDFSLTKIISIDKADSLRVVSDNVIELFRRISRKELQYSYYNWNQDELWGNTGDQWVDIISRKYVKLRDRLDVNVREFTLRDINNGLPLWYYTLPEGFQIFGSVKAIDDVLFFRATDSKLDYSKTIGLNIETGEKLWEVEGTMYLQLDSKRKLLMGYANDTFQVLDPFKGEIVIQKKMADSYSMGVSPSSSNNTITDDKLWFVSGRGENAKFGALDLSTSEIDFIQDFPLEEDAQFDKPVYHDGKLYLRDSNNVLYVLE